MALQNQYFPQSVSHPCETLVEKLEEMGMGPKEFALRTGKPDKTITAILKGDSSITPDMAVQFENDIEEKKGLLERVAPNLKVRYTFNGGVQGFFKNQKSDALLLRHILYTWLLTLTG